MKQDIPTQGPSVPGVDMTGLRVGLDIDGTITLDPPLFTQLARGCRQAGGQVHIVTSRSEASRQATIEELHRYGLYFDALHFIGDMSRAQENCPHRSLDWYQAYLWQKVAYANQHGLTHFVDDDPKVLSLFTRYASETLPLSAADRVSIGDPAYEQATYLVLAQQSASASLLQRCLNLEVGRAQRLLQAMADAGLVRSHPDPDGLWSIRDRYFKRSIIPQSTGEDHVRRG